jgi:hypothetical protein
VRPTNIPVRVAMGSCIVLRTSILMASSLARIRLSIVLHPMTNAPHLGDKRAQMRQAEEVVRRSVPGAVSGPRPSRRRSSWARSFSPRSP